MILGSNGFFRRRLPAAASWWLSGGISPANAIGVYQPIGAASLAASYTNLANPGTYDAAPGVAPTFNAATGWGFNGTEYLTTGVQPIQNQIWTMIIRAADVDSGAANRSAAGAVWNSTAQFRMAFDYNASFNRVLYSSNASLSTSPRLPSGVLAIAGRQAYRNGLPDGGLLTEQSGTQTVSLFIGGISNAGTPNEFFIGNIQAVAIYDTTLTGAQVLAVSNAMASL
jgi:hypothetical protein